MVITQQCSPDIFGILQYCSTAQAPTQDPYSPFLCLWRPKIPKDPPLIHCTWKVRHHRIQAPKWSLSISPRHHHNPLTSHQKHISFSMPLHNDTPEQPQNSSQHMPRPAIKATPPQNTAPSQDHQSITHTTAQVHDIIGLKCTFPAPLHHWQHFWSLNYTPAPLHHWQHVWSLNYIPRPFNTPCLTHSL